MRNSRLLSMVLAAILAGATVSQADIIAELESPANVQVVSGVSLFRGWAFSEGEDEEEVNVQLVIDGVINEGFSVACCSSRQDIVNAHPGERLDSGFGAVVNYAELSPGPHTIGVHLSATDEDSLVINHSVFVIRPGNTDFVDNFDLSGAACAISGNTIELTGVDVDGTMTDLEAEYATNLQALTLTGASGAPALTQFVANLTSNQEVPRVDFTDSEGTATVNLNSNNTLTYALTTTSLEEATAAHIHLGSAAEAGPIIFPLTGGPTSWAGTTGVLSAEQLTALNEGLLYINVHTLENPNGEIRGTIVAAP